MPISKDHLEARLTELKTQLEQLRQQFAATTGAIADIEYWIAEESKPSNTEIKES